MRLVDLRPRWVFEFDPANGSMREAHDVNTPLLDDDDDRDLPTVTAAQAQGVIFLCPACFAKNNGPVGTESVLCWFRGRGVPDNAEPGPGRWAVTGGGFRDLTLTPSVNVQNGHWHGFITNGEMR
jgi:Family of unknown function (DUF6527)